jgi:hypothetical protein
MKPAPIHRRIFAVLIAFLLAFLVVGLAGQLSHWGELAPLSFMVSLLGLWTVGTVAWRP